jgi:CRP/FNR family transcriptional regulator, polysaccharide utilization system transcription regulator
MNQRDCMLPTGDELTFDQINRINKDSFLVKIKKNEQIFSQDKPITHLMFLRSGLVKLFKDGPNDKSVILQITGSGNYIGLLSVFSGNLYQFSATSLEESEMIYTNISTLNEIIRENGRYGLYLLKQQSHVGMTILNKMFHFPQQQVPGRIAEVLMYFSNEIYNNNHFTLPLSRQELADLIYSTKESVSRTLTEFKNDRIIEIDDRKVILNSIDLLKILCKLG